MYLYNKIKHYSIPEPVQDFSGITSKIVLVYSKLSPEESAFLNKMIIAFKWHAEDIFHLEINPDDIESYSRLWSNKSLKILWLFDIVPETVGIFMQLPKYQLYRLTNFDLYYSDTLSTIEMNNAFKSKVWLTLKEIKID